MSKKLTKLIAEAELKRTQQVAGIKNRSAFLSLREDIKEAMGDGWALKQIYRTLHTQNKITFSYQTFVNYANALILKPKPLAITSNRDAKSHVEQQVTNPSAKISMNNSQELPGFIFNPIAKKEDLI